MSEKIDYKNLISEVEELLHRHGLNTLGCTLSLTVSKEVFEALSNHAHNYQSDFMLAE